MKKTSNPEQKRLRQRLTEWLHSSASLCVLMVICTGLVLLGMTWLVSAPERYSLTVGSIARQNINATKDVTDAIATEKARNDAAAAVEPTYHLQEGVADQVLLKLNSVFSELRTVQQYGITLRNVSDTDADLRNRAFTADEIAYAQKIVTQISLSYYQTTTLLRTGNNDFDTMVSTVTTAVENALNTGIREGKVSEAITTIQQIVGYRVDISLTQNILSTVLRACLQPNLVIDQESTEAARQRAMDAVDPVICLQGQNIIRQGDVVTLNQYEMIKSLGLLRNDQIDYSVYIGSSLLVLSSMLILVILLHLTDRKLLHDTKRTAVIMSVILIAAGAAAIIIKSANAYFTPAALGAMLLLVLLGWRTAVAAVPSLALLISGLAAGNSTSSMLEMIGLFLMTLTGSIVAISYEQGKAQRTRLIVCGILVAITNAAEVMAMALLSSLDTSGMVRDMLWAASGGLLSAALVIGLQPVFEAVFNLATPSKLLELCNPNQPLLRKLLLEASGTYHHSIVVANLAEAAAERIGANPLLARTGAYYHDVGKLKRPQYFKENQIGENPLIEKDPYVAAGIVTSHTKDGLQLAQKYHLPVEVQQIILQHHGDTPVMYFYHKALQMPDGKAVDIKDFRYSGPRPKSREAAIIMLADTVEAAVRSMPDPTPQAIQENIERLLRGKIEDGQLSDCPLSLRDIDSICEAFASVLNGVFHERIAYPQAAIPKRNLFERNETKPEEPEGRETKE